MSKQHTQAQTINAPLSPLLIQIISWGLAGLVCIVATLAWGHDYGWHLLPFSPYQTFPLLGLLAFSIMWSHYMITVLRDISGTKRSVLKYYFRYTGYAVLALICLHPGLLIYQRFRDGYGLPPHSYESYVAPGLGWITLLGSVSFLVFISFEFRRVWGKKPWFRYVMDASDFAMLAILYHGFRLGTQLRQGWFRYVWLFYAVTLVGVLVRKYFKRYQAL